MHPRHLALPVQIRLKILPPRLDSFWNPSARRAPSQTGHPSSHPIRFGMRVMQMKRMMKQSFFCRAITDFRRIFFRRTRVTIVSRLNCNSDGIELYP
jgi:hypothetical protein